MDKNTIIGFVLIFLILIGYSWWIQPSAEEKAAAQHRRDSIAMAQETERMAAMLEAELAQTAIAEEQPIDHAAMYGEFAKAAKGEEHITVLENNLLRLELGNKGGRIYSAELKNYRTCDSLPLILFDRDESQLNFTLLTRNHRVINTEELYFEPIVADSQTVIMRLVIDSISHLDFTYSLAHDDYMVHFDIRAHNMAQHLSAQTNMLEMNWEQDIRQQEKSRKFESRYATLNYRYNGDDMEQMSESKNDLEKTSGKVRWIAFKDQFFSTILIAENTFQSPTLESTVLDKRPGYLKHYKAQTSVAFDAKGNEATRFSMFLGPNQYKILRSYDADVERAERLRLEKIIPLGWAIFRWVSEWLVIPIFNFLNRFISNFGIIILLMTIIVKLIILPFTYKSYLSTAKMRVLKPQIDEINAKFPPEKAMERQQATMALYNKVGVSPMSGCLPMLLQMPILFAMFAFFPTAIELRQQSFLWAHDLSSYDAIFSWDTYIPFITPYFGNHISLFCLLMTITNIIYTKINMANTNTEGQPGAGMMKWMMYLMPIMFLFIFNDYASGLSYYYFISLLFTILQTYLFRLFIDDKKLLAQLEAKKTKTQKKSSFMQRLEAAQRAQMKAMQEQRKR